MKKKKKLWKIGVVSIIGLVIGLCLQFQWHKDTLNTKPTGDQSIGNVQTLATAYERWKTRAALSGADSSLVLPLSYSRGHSAEFTTSSGLATLDLFDGTLSIEVSGLPDNSTYDVWLIDKQSNPQQNTKLKAYNSNILAGQLASSNEPTSLQVQLNADELAGFELDRIVVSRSGDAPEKGEMLSGSPNLFQRFYYNEQRGVVVRLETSQNARDSQIPAPFRFLVPQPAYAQQSGAVDLAALITQGEELFLNETFDGNGRTCGTCHRPENNFTIDPDFIATLPPDDPLFVAEFNEGLAGLENPTLMREFGLILANVDGLENPTGKFVMRSVSHTLGLSVSIQSDRTEPPFEQTGWSGDGAPGGGRLRDFATGAVTQHAPKTLNRVAGEDFRLPTEAELDAMEAFQLSLGRQTDFDIDALRLTDSNAEEGRVLFTTVDSQNQTVKAAKCILCHDNAGAFSPTGINRNFDTGVENMSHPADLTGELRPRDGGFGKQSDSNGGFGDGTFNTQSLWEAADTPPYFHNNLAMTLEDAISFYDSPEFRNSHDGQLILATDSGGQEMSIEVDALAAFLRVINALENTRATIDFMTRAKVAVTDAVAQKLLRLAQTDVEDTLLVLAESELHEEDAVPHVEEANNKITEALDTSLSVEERNGLIDDAISETNTARSMMVVSEPVPIATSQPDPTTTTTLPAPTTTVPVTVTTTTTTLPVVTTTTLPPVDTIPPTITNLIPVDGSEVCGTVMISVDASDASGIQMVVFEEGNQMVGQNTTAPFEQQWNTNMIFNGLKTLRVTAVDTLGNSSTVTALVTVRNSFYSPCTNPTPTPTPDPTADPNPTPTPTPPTSPPDPLIPPGQGSADQDAQGIVLSKDPNLFTVTIGTEEGNVTVKITSATEFLGSVASSFNEIIVGHEIQAEFFAIVNEAVKVETNFPENGF